MTDEGRIDDLIAMLDSADVATRANAAAALGNPDAMRAVEVLIGRLQDESIWVRCSAAESLGFIGDNRAVEPLVQALRTAQVTMEDQGKSVRVESRHDPAYDRWVDEHGYGDLAETGFDMRESAEKALTMISVAGVGQMIAFLGDEDARLRAVIVRVLGKIGGRATLAALVAALADRSIEVRLNAASGLGRVGNVAAVEPLLDALEDRDSRMRRAAVEALGWIMDRRAVDPLVAQLNDPDGWVQSAAAEALGRLGDPAATGPLVAAVIQAERRESDWIEARIKQIEDAEIEDAAIIETMAARLRDAENPYQRTRAAAADALRKLGHESA
jgi:HEAT repeat protein